MMVVWISRHLEAYISFANSLRLDEPRLLVRFAHGNSRYPHVVETYADMLIACLRIDRVNRGYRAAF